MPTNPSTQPQIPNAGQQPSGNNIGPQTPAPPTSGTTPVGQLPPPPAPITTFIDSSLLLGTIPDGTPAGTGGPAQPFRDPGVVGH